MLSYQHGYHAGNFADVFKHLALTRVFTYLKIKDKPLFYLETHSGKGKYDLRDKQAEKNQEYKLGIDLLWEQRDQLPTIFNEYIQALHQLNPNQALRYYPGSPYLAIQSLRAQDRLYLCELHPGEYSQLNQLPHFQKKVHVSNSDGIASLKALLPPPEKRGFVFIDPSFEVKDDYKTVPQAIKDSVQHFSQGVYGLWYPIVDKKFTEQMIKGMSAIGATNTLRMEFHLTQARQAGMTGTGLCFINPPYTLAEEMKVGLEQLKRLFNPGESYYLIDTF